MKQPYFASSESVEHYTPRYIWERAIRCMGAIDCDPAADPGHGIPAAVHYTKKENGLIHPWEKRVWLNPPFGDLIPQFYIGPNPEKFIAAFSDIADIWKPLQRAEKKTEPGQLRLFPEPIRKKPSAENHPLGRWRSTI